jgi:hypothetical protein
LDRLYKSEEFFPQEMKVLFKNLETHISLTHPLGGPILIAGLVVLRLISPAILYPAKYDLMPGITLTGPTMRTLVLITKVIQNLANGGNESDNYMKIISLWTKRHIIEWRAFFRKLINDKTVEPDFATVNITPEDLLNYSSPSNSEADAKYRHMQLEIIRFCLDVESSAEGWKVKKSNNFTLYFRVMADTARFICKGEVKVQGPVEEVYYFLKENEETKVMNPVLAFADVIETINDSASIMHIGIQLPVIANR